MNTKIQVKKFVFIITLFWFAQYVYVPYQTPYLSSIQVASSFIGIVIGIYGFSQMLLRIPLGIAADYKINYKLLVVIGTILAGGASVFRIIIPNGWGFLIGNIFSGVASAAWLGFMLLFFKINNQASKTKNMGILVMFNNLGILLGFLISSLFYDKVSMVGLCILSVLAGIIAIFLAITLPKERVNVVAGKEALKNLAYLVKDKNLFICSILALIQQGVQMATTMSFTTEVINKLHTQTYAEGLSSLIYMVAAVLFAKITTTNFINKFSSKEIAIASFLLIVVYCILIPNMTSVYPIYFLQLIPGMATGILFAILNSKALENISDNMLATATGYFQTIYAIGMTLFPIIAGKLNQLFSMKLAFYFLGFLGLLGLIISIVYDFR